MKPFYKYLVPLAISLSVLYISVLAFMNVLSFKEITALFHSDKTVNSKKFSNDQGGGTHTFIYDNIASVHIDFWTIDNSFQLTINGTPIHNNKLELELEEFNKGDVHLIFASDGKEVLAPWIANKNNLPRLRLKIDHSGEIILEGTRNIHATTLEKIQLSDHSKFNTIATFKEQTIITITNINERGLDGMKGSIRVSEERTIHKNTTNAI